VKEHFDEEAKTNVIYIIRNIRDAFKKLLNEVTWMDEETKDLAREKVDAIQELIGYPDYIMDDALLDADYEELNIDPDKYFENCEANLIETSKKMLKTLRQPVNKTRWTTNVAMVNAFYSATKNLMMFPAGILQPPFYHKNYPMSMNFGGIAMVIGHEMIHGFDNRGRQYDKSGNMKQWWANSSIEGFNQRVQCVIDQYSNYTVEEINMNINGEQTQGENIADNVGLKVAFAAYNTWVERTNRRDEPLLPGLSLNHQQLFFLNFAQIWCGTVRPEAYFQSIISGRHCPGRYRVKGVLSNSVDFAKAFNCPTGSRMNPPNKCTVW
jgi:membrane metallo-endopeptidase-like protein 1